MAPNMRKTVLRILGTVSQSAHRVPTSLHSIFVLRRLTDHWLAVAAGSKAAENRYAKLLLTSFVYILEEGVVRVSKQ